MENNLENKVRFFAQYWGQEVLRWKLNSGKMSSTLIPLVERHMGIKCTYLQNGYLELTPLSQISYEDKIHICSLLGIANYKDSYGFEDLFVSVNNNIQSYLSDDSIDFTLECYDYLRSRGYALPWMGLSVETLVEYGWVKLNKG